MRFLLLAALWLLVVFHPLPAQAAWNADWKQRVKIGFDTTAQRVPLQAAVDGAPVLIRLHTGNFQFLEAKPDGSDLRFIAADDKTPLKFHVEKFDSVNELALVWVIVPRLNPGLQTEHIWAYYGNPAATAASDPKTSFDAAQQLVYHFDEREPLPQDTTAYGHHAQASTAKASGAGLIGGGLAFDGKASLQLPPAVTLQPGAQGLTLSFWVKPAEAGDALLIGGEAPAGLRLSLQAGRLTAQAGTLTASAPTALTPGAWQHVALVAKDGLQLYLNGQEAARATGALPAAGGPVSVGRGFKGDIDELQIASTARPVDWIRLAALSQGQDQKLLSYGSTEGAGAEDGGSSYMKILLGAVTIDGWIVIAILGVMFLVSIYVMAAKAAFVRAAARDNGRFKSQFDSLLETLSRQGDGLADEAEEKAHAARFKASSLYRLYAAGARELRHRFAACAKAGKPPLLNDLSINAIRASIDAGLVRETQRLNSQMVLLTICISGGPFLGLLGTVVGVMITFAAIAAAGDVNVNSIAPGIAAALVATVAGLAVAIPALFGYNYLTSRIGELSSDMEVFIDEFVTRLAESHSS